MNITTVIIPWKNKKDLVEIPEEYREQINFIPVKTFEEVLEIALVGWKDNIKRFKKKAKKSSGKKDQDNFPPVAA